MSKSLPPPPNYFHKIKNNLQSDLYESLVDDYKDANEQLEYVQDGCNDHTTSVTSQKNQDHSEKDYHGAVELPLWEEQKQERSIR